MTSALRRRIALAAAVFVGGTWYSIDGPLTWALGTLDGTVPGASALALDELERNTLHAHATAYPDHWSGVLDVDRRDRDGYTIAPSLPLRPFSLRLPGIGTRPRRVPCAATCAPSRGADPVNPTLVHPFGP